MPADYDLQSTLLHVLAQAGAERIELGPDQARQGHGIEHRAALLDQRGRAVRKLIEPDLFDLPVLAFNELSSMTRLEMVGQIGLPAGTLANDEAEVSSVVAAE